MAVNHGQMELLAWFKDKDGKRVVCRLYVRDVVDAGLNSVEYWRFLRDKNGEPCLEMSSEDEVDEAAADGKSVLCPAGGRDL